MSTGTTLQVSICSDFSVMKWRTTLKKNTNYLLSRQPVPNASIFLIWRYLYLQLTYLTKTSSNLLVRVLEVCFFSPKLYWESCNLTKILSFELGLLSYDVLQYLIHYNSLHSFSSFFHSALCFPSFFPELWNVSYGIHPWCNFRRINCSFEIITCRPGQMGKKK